MSQWQMISQKCSCPENGRVYNLLPQEPESKVDGAVSPSQVLVWYPWPPDIIKMEQYTLVFNQCLLVLLQILWHTF